MASVTPSILIVLHESFEVWCPEGSISWTISRCYTHALGCVITFRVIGSD